MRLLLGTTNNGKAIEIKNALATLACEIMVPTDVGIQGDCEEPHETLHENALFKARYYFQRSGGIPTIADDTGLYVDAIADELGVKTRRWGAGEHATDDEWLTFFLRRMEHEENRQAKFECALAYIDADGKEYLFDGESRGTITREPQAAFLPGLPVSSVFLPEGYDRVFSALTLEEKHALSHRGRAIAAFLKHVEKA